MRTTIMHPRKSIARSLRARAASAVAVVLAAVLPLTPAMTHAQQERPQVDATTTQTTPARTGYATANGIRYYYEIRGTGEPLLLLHGGLGSIDMFAPLMPQFTRGRQVIAVDLHGHGRTELGDRQIDLVDIANDLAIVLDQLGIESVDALGYSFGGGAAFRLAVQHPQRVRRLAIVSAGFSPDGYHPELRPMQAQVGASMAEQMKDTPMHRSYMAVAPKPEDFPRLLDAMGALMRRHYNWAEDVKTLRMPVLLVYGDADMFRLQHVMEFYQLLGGGLRDAGWMREHMSQNRLAILPNATHYDIFLSPMLPATVLPFLNDEKATRSWDAETRTRN